MKQPHKLLKNAFDRQKKMNSDLSLRSLAEKLRISPGFLSKVFSGQKGLTPALAEKLCLHLRMDSLQKDQMMVYLQENLLQKKFGKGPEIKNKKSVQSLQEMVLMSDDAEWLLAKWYRLPILDLATCKDFQSDPAWIAHRLDISEAEAGEALDKLEKYGFLSRNASGQLIKTHELLRFPAKFSKAIIRDFHTLQMKRAMNYMNQNTDQSSFHKRLIAGLGVAVNPTNIEKAKTILHQALYEAAEILQEGDCSEVYQLNLQMFPHTR